MYRAADNATSQMILPTELRVNPLYISLYMNWLYLLFMYFIPFLILIILNFMYVNKLNKMKG